VDSCPPKARRLRHPRRQIEKIKNAGATARRAKGLSVLCHTAGSGAKIGIAPARHNARAKEKSV